MSRSPARPVLRSLGLLLLAAACSRSPGSVARADDGAAPPPTAAPAPTATAPDPTAPAPAAPPAKDKPVTPAATEVTLKSKSSPRATVGELAITLMSAITVAKPSGEGEKLERSHRVKLHLEKGADKRDMFLGSGAAISFAGYSLTLSSARDGQDTPQSPRESIVVIAVTPAP